MISIISSLRVGEAVALQNGKDSSPAETSGWQFPELPYKTVNYYYNLWRKEGRWDDMMNALRDAVRKAAGRESAPTVVCIDSQTAKTADQGSEVGYDGGKRTNGRKRHIVTDVLGLLLLVNVTAANVHDAVAADPLLRRLDAEHPTINLVHADLGYRGELVEMVDRELGFT